MEVNELDKLDQQIAIALGWIPFDAGSKDEPIVTPMYLDVPDNTGKRYLNGYLARSLHLCQYPDSENIEDHKPDCECWISQSGYPVWSPTRNADHALLALELNPLDFPISSTWCGKYWKFEVCKDGTPFPLGTFYKKKEPYSFAEGLTRVLLDAVANRRIIL